MFGVTCNEPTPSLLKSVGSIWATAFVIKLMDDYLDFEYDQELGRRTLAHKLQRAVLPYCLIIFTLGCLMNPQIAAAYFIAAYATGMVGEMPRVLPSLLTGYHETILVLIIGLLGVGWRQLLLALLVIMTIQAVDDVLDYENERDRSSRNWVVRWRKERVIPFAFLSGMLAIAIDPMQTLAALLGTWIVNRIVSLPSTVGTTSSHTSKEGEDLGMD